MNHELAQLYGDPSIKKVAKAGRIQWAGHVVKMPDNNPAKMVFTTNPAGGQTKWSKTWKGWDARDDGGRQPVTELNGGTL